MFIRNQFWVGISKYRKKDFLHLITTMAISLDPWDDKQKQHLCRKLFSRKIPLRTVRVAALWFASLSFYFSSERQHLPSKSKCQALSDNDAIYSITIILPNSFFSDWTSDTKWHYNMRIMVQCQMVLCLYTVLILRTKNLISMIQWRSSWCCAQCKLSWVY